VFYVLGASTDSPHNYDERVSQGADNLEDLASDIAEEHGLDERLVRLAIVETALQRDRRK
jgi:hypothetical protein